MMNHWMAVHAAAVTAVRRMRRRTGRSAAASRRTACRIVSGTRSSWAVWQRSVRLALVRLGLLALAAAPAETVVSASVATPVRRRVATRSLPFRRAGRRALVVAHDARPNTWRRRPCTAPARRVARRFPTRRSCGRRNRFRRRPIRSCHTPSGPSLRTESAPCVVTSLPTA